MAERVDSDEFSFASFLEERAQPGGGLRPEAYALPSDLRVVRGVTTLRPLRLAMESSVRFWQEVARGSLLARSVPATPEAFPRVAQALERCAARLGMNPPQVYLSPESGASGAGALGTSEEALILLQPALLEPLDDAALAFVLGRECGHVHCGHTVLRTVAYSLGTAAGLALRWVVAPVHLTLHAWSRRAELSADRAGLLCCGSLEAALRGLLALELGGLAAASMEPRRLLEEPSAPAHRLGRLGEMLEAKPGLRLRAQALELFERSLLYQRVVLGEDHGLPQDHLEERVAALLTGQAAPGGRA